MNSVLLYSCSIVRTFILLNSWHFGFHACMLLSLFEMHESSTQQIEFIRNIIIYTIAACTECIVHSSRTRRIMIFAPKSYYYLREWFSLCYCMRSNRSPIQGGYRQLYCKHTVIVFHNTIDCGSHIDFILDIIYEYRSWLLWIMWIE